MLTVNTIIYEDELETAHDIMLKAQEAGVDAFIVQDSALFGFEDISVPLHASTQCSIRSLEDARRYEALGAGRVVLERELPLERIREICSGTACEVECFVHGALCVCYSGQCYMSEAVAGRSANRGECVQACRSRYDLVDAGGNVLVRDKALLSLKDLDLLGRLGELADAGVDSFKIEGRLKSISYVRNVVRQYSLALDSLIEARPGKYRRASSGRVSSGFSPNLEKTFNRGYTELYLDGRRGRWSSMDAPTHLGEPLGKVLSVKRHGQSMELGIGKSGIPLANGDGFCFQDASGEVLGFRGDVCREGSILAKDMPSLKPGTPLFRNIDSAFEKAMDRDACRREIGVVLNVRISGSYNLSIDARSEDGRRASISHDVGTEAAKDAGRAIESLRSQLSKRHLHYIASVGEISADTPDGSLPFVAASQLNAIRREAIEALDAMPVPRQSMYVGVKSQTSVPESLSYKSNIANSKAEAAMRQLGATSVESAYELSHRAGAELMRTRYCIKYELGLCPRFQGHAPTGPLFLVNNGRRFALGFDCAACEMTVSEA